MSEKVSVLEFPWDRLLLVGDYDRFDLWDQYDEEAFGVLPPIGYKEGEAL